jgi:predicted transcriptional regulator of viral defense system
MIQQYIDRLAQAGKASFSSREAEQALGISKQALAMALSRLRKKGMLVSPYRDFYVPLPPEYRALGCLPANQLIPLLMKHMQADYYVCLLSAAAIHGAAHQRPQITQVMLAKRMHAIRCGSVAIDFIYKKELVNVSTQLVTVPTGYLNVSAPEVTAMDLLLYSRQSGGINHIATVLTELIEVIDPEKLLSLAKISSEHAWVQRLGYILEQIDPVESVRRDECVRLLKEYIQQTKPSYIPLVTRPVKGYSRDKSWRVIKNTSNRE